MVEGSSQGELSCESPAPSLLSSWAVSVSTLKRGHGWNAFVCTAVHASATQSHFCCRSVAQSCLTLCDPLDHRPSGFLSFSVSRSLFTSMSIESVMLSNHLILYCPFLHLPFIFSQHLSLFQSVGFCIRWPKHWSFSLSSEYSALISFRSDWFDLLAVQGTLMNLLQHHKLKALVLWCSAFFMVQLSRLYMTPGKTTAFTIWTFVGKVMSLLLNTFSVLFLVVQSFPTRCDSIDCSPPGFSVHGDSLGKNTEVGCHAPLQGIFLTQGLNPGLLHCRRIHYCEPLGKPNTLSRFVKFT